MKNYPDTVNHNDSDAPWNIKDVPSFSPHYNGICKQCETKTSEPEDLNEDDLCEECFAEQQEEELDENT